LNRAIEVLVIERVLVMPDASRRIGHLITHEPDAIVAVIWFDLIYCRASPGFDGRLLALSGTYGIEGERLVDSSYAVLFVRSVIILVALVRMTLAPGAFVRNDVFRFRKIRCPWVLGRAQVTNVNENSVRSYVVTMARVIVRVWVLGEEPGEWVDPCAGTDQVLGAVQAGAVCVRATGAKMIAAYAVASKAARV